MQPGSEFPPRRSASGLAFTEMPNLRAAAVSVFTCVLLLLLLIQCE